MKTRTRLLPKVLLAVAVAGLLVLATGCDRGYGLDYDDGHYVRPYDYGGSGSSQPYRYRRPYSGRSYYGGYRGGYRGGYGGGYCY